MERLTRPDLTLSPTMGWRRYAPWLPEPSGELTRWAEAAAELYLATLEEASAVVAVDTSKGPARASWLWKSGVVDLRFIWLTRRLEDVLRSQIKHGHSALKTAVSWRLAQRQAALMARQVERGGGRVPRISYERFTEQPRTVLSEILEYVGLPWHEDVLTPRPGHVIGGDHKVKHGGRYVIEPSTGTRPPLPFEGRLALRLLDPGLPAPTV
jgi:hypothetical protein